MAKRSKKSKANGSGVSAKAAETGAVTQRLPAWLGRDWLWGSILVLAVVLAYSPVGWAGYIWDDDAVVTANPVIVGPLGLKEIWTTRAADICPLTLTTFWVEYALWGANPLPYHLVNVLLHGASAVLLWRVLRSLRVPGAWLGAALWALHPVEVESVAWITELKNTQSCLFYLLAILFFVKMLRSGGGCNYGLTLLFAALAMAHFQKALEINPLYAGAHGNLGSVLMSKGQVEKAIAQYQELLEINPNDANAFLSLGIAKETKGDWEGALSNLRRYGEIAGLSPNADYAHLYIWLIRAQQNQKAEADQELRACLSHHWIASPKDWVSINAGFLLNQMSEGDYLAAAASTNAKTNQDQHCEPWYYVGMNRLLANDRATASDYFHNCLATGESGFFEYWLAQAELKALTPSH